MFHDVTRIRAGIPHRYTAWNVADLDLTTRRYLRYNRNFYFLASNEEEEN